MKTETVGRVYYTCKSPIIGRATLPADILSLPRPRLVPSETTLFLLNFTLYLRWTLLYNIHKKSGIPNVPKTMLKKNSILSQRFQKI